jgi:hypothetical protein
LKRLSVDNGKPVEKQGRKATGPNAKAMAAWPPKLGVFLILKLAVELILKRINSIKFFAA